MTAMIEAPVRLLEEVAHLRLPVRVDDRLQKLMDLNTQAALTAEQREELLPLVEWTESVSLLRAQAFKALGVRPE